MNVPHVSLQQRGGNPVRIATITPLSGDRVCVRVYEAGHSAASGHSNSQLSSQGSPRSTAVALMRPSASAGGVCVPSSHFEIVACDTAAISAIWACVAPKTRVRICNSGVVMPEPYAETNTASSRNSETHSGSLYPWGMSTDVQELLFAMERLLGKDQKDIAKIADVGQSTVSKWRSGQHDPNKDAWEKILVHAANDPLTKPYVHRYIINLLGSTGMQGLFDAALGGNKPPPEAPLPKPKKQRKPRLSKQPVAPPRTNQERK